MKGIVFSFKKSHSTAKRLSFRMPDVVSALRKSGVTVMFVILLLVQLLPDRSTKEVHTGALLAFAIGLEAVTLAVSFLIKKKESLSLLLDIVGFIFVLLTLWSLATAKFNVLNDLLFPAPGKVLHQFAEDREKILINSAGMQDSAVPRPTSPNSSARSRRSSISRMALRCSRPSSRSRSL